MVAVSGSRAQALQPLTQGAHPPKLLWGTPEEILARKNALTTPRLLHVAIQKDGEGLAFRAVAIDVASRRTIAALSHRGVPASRLLPLVRDAIAILSACPPQGRLSLRWAGPEGILYVDGRFVGPAGTASPVSLTLTAGLHDLAILSPDREALWTQTITLPSGLHTPLELAPELPGEASSSSGWMSTAAWVCGGLSLAALGPAIGLGISAEDVEEDFHSTAEIDGVIQMTWAQAQDMAETAEDRALQANILYVAAGVAAAAAITFFVWDYLTRD